MRLSRVGTLAVLSVLLAGVGAAASPGRGPALRLTVRGDGRVTCSKACTGVHRLGSILTLTARPAANYDFDQWSGACIGVVPSCPVALDRSAALTASFV